VSRNGFVWGPCVLGVLGVCGCHAAFSTQLVLPQQQLPAQNVALLAEEQPAADQGAC
jgi:hypothetical protein